MEQGLATTRSDWQPLVDWGLLRYDPIAANYQLHSLTIRHAETLLTPSQRAPTQLIITHIFPEWVWTW
jgi:hypothetical protein